MPRSEYYGKAVHDRAYELRANLMGEAYHLEQIINDHYLNKTITTLGLSDYTNHLMSSWMSYLNERVTPFSTDPSTLQFSDIPGATRAYNASKDFGMGLSSNFGYTTNIPKANLGIDVDKIGSVNLSINIPTNLYSIRVRSLATHKVLIGNNGHTTSGDTSYMSIYIHDFNDSINEWRAINFATTALLSKSDDTDDAAEWQTTMLTDFHPHDVLQLEYDGTFNHWFIICGGGSDAGIIATPDFETFYYKRVECTSTKDEEFDLRGWDTLLQYQTEAHTSYSGKRAYAYGCNGKGCSIELTESSGALKKITTSARDYNNTSGTIASVCAISALNKHVILPSYAPSVTFNSQYQSTWCTSNYSGNPNRTNEVMYAFHIPGTDYIYHVKDNGGVVFTNDYEGYTSLPSTGLSISSVVAAAYGKDVILIGTNNGLWQYIGDYNGTHLTGNWTKLMDYSGETTQGITYDEKRGEFLVYRAASTGTPRIIEYHLPIKIVNKPKNINFADLNTWGESDHYYPPKFPGRTDETYQCTMFWAAAGGFYGVKDPDVDGSVLVDYRNYNFNYPVKEHRIFSRTVRNPDGSRDQLWHWAMSKDYGSYRSSGLPDHKLWKLVPGKTNALNRFSVFGVFSKDNGGVGIYVTKNFGHINSHRIISTDLWDEYISDVSYYKDLYQYDLSMYPERAKIATRVFTKYFGLLGNELYAILNFDRSIATNTMVIEIYSPFSSTPLRSFAYGVPSGITLHDYLYGGFSCYTNVNGELIIYPNNVDVPGIIIGTGKHMETGYNSDFDFFADDHNYDREVIETPVVGKYMQHGGFIFRKLSDIPSTTDISISTADTYAGGSTSLPAAFTTITFGDASRDNGSENEFDLMDPDNVTLYVPSEIPYMDSMDTDFSGYIASVAYPDAHQAAATLLKAASPYSVSYGSSELARIQNADILYSSGALHYNEAQEGSQLFSAHGKLYSVSGNKVNYLMKNGTVINSQTFDWAEEILAIGTCGTHTIYAGITPAGIVEYDAISPDQHYTYHYSTNKKLAVWGGGRYRAKLHILSSYTTTNLIFLSDTGNGNLLSTTLYQYANTEITYINFTNTSEYITDYTFNDSRYLLSLMDHAIRGHTVVNGVDTETCMVYFTATETDLEPLIGNNFNIDNTFSGELFKPIGGSWTAIMLGDVDFSSMCATDATLPDPNDNTKTIAASIYWGWQTSRLYSSLENVLKYSYDGIAWNEAANDIATPFHGNDVMIFGSKDRLGLIKGKEVAVLSTNNVYYNHPTADDFGTFFIDSSGLDIELYNIDDYSDNSVSSIATDGFDTFVFMNLATSGTNGSRANNFVSFSLTPIPDTLIYNENYIGSTFTEIYPTLGLRTTYAGNMLNEEHNKKLLNNPSFTTAKRVRNLVKDDNDAPTYWTPPNNTDELTGIDRYQEFIYGQYLGEDVYMLSQIEISGSAVEGPYAVVENVPYNDTYKLNVLRGGRGSIGFVDNMSLAISISHAKYFDGTIVSLMHTKEWPLSSYRDGLYIMPKLNINIAQIDNTATNKHDKYKVLSRCIELPLPKIWYQFWAKVLPTRNGFFFRTNNDLMYSKNFEHFYYAQQFPSARESGDGAEQNELIAIECLNTSPDKYYIALNRAFVYDAGTSYKPVKQYIYYAKADPTTGNPGSWSKIPFSSLKYQRGGNTPGLENLFYLEGSNQLIMTGMTNYDGDGRAAINKAFLPDQRRGYYYLPSNNFSTTESEFGSTSSSSYYSLISNTEYWVENPEPAGVSFYKPGIILCGNTMINIQQLASQGKYRIWYTEFGVSNAGFHYIDVPVRYKGAGSVNTYTNEAMDDESKLSSNMRLMYKDPTHFAVLLMDNHTITNSYNNGSNHIDEFVLTADGPIMI